MFHREGFCLNLLPSPSFRLGKAFTSQNIKFTGHLSDDRLLFEALHSSAISQVYSPSVDSAVDKTCCADDGVEVDTAGVVVDAGSCSVVEGAASVLEIQSNVSLMSGR